MKTTKRLLAVLLAVLLGLAVLAPMTSAADDSAYAPIITKQPKAEVTVFTGKELVLEVEAKLPDGVEGTLSYEWISSLKRRVVGTDAKLIFPITWYTTSNYSGMPYHFQDDFHVVVTDTYIDEDGEVQTVSVKSNACRVTIVKDLGGFLRWWLNGVTFIPFDILMHVQILFGLPLYLYDIIIKPISQYIGLYREAKANN